MVNTVTDSAVLHALRRRRSAPRMTDVRPPRELVEHIIEAGAQAPNHHKTRPWRFVVVAGASRDALGSVMADSAAAGASGLREHDLDALREKQRGKPLRAPVIIAVAVEPSSGPKVIEIEEVEAGAAAVQNMLLAAEALGLGAMWRTGPAAYDPAVKRLLGLSARAHIVAFVYLGYPDVPDLPQREREAQSLTRWMGWDTISPDDEAPGDDFAHIGRRARPDQTDDSRG